MGTVTIASFKTQFSRNFTFGSALPDVLDDDITKAIAEKDAVFNPEIYPTDTPAIGTLAEHYLTAHFLASDIDAADSGGQPRFMQTSRGADGVSESVQIPDDLKGEFAFYCTTYYGQKWLMLTRPYLGGAVFSIQGGTQP